MAAHTFTEPLADDTEQRLVRKFAISLGVTSARADDTIHRLWYRIALHLGADKPDLLDSTQRLMYKSAVKLGVTDARFDDLEQRLLWKILNHLQTPGPCCAGVHDNAQRILDQIVQDSETPTPPPPPPPIHQVSWSPGTELMKWSDVNGVQVGDLPTFLATADFSSVVLLDAQHNHVTSITGLSFLPALQNFVASDHWSVTTLDFTGCNNILSISVDVGGTLTALIVAGCSTLTSLTCPLNQFTSLDVTGCVSLQTLDCDTCPNLTAITGLLTCSSLTTLVCFSCNITGTLDVHGLSNLAILNCSSNPSLTGLTLTGCTALTTLTCNNCALSGLDVTTCTALDDLQTQANPFGTNHTLDLSNCTVLNNVYGYDCPGIQVVDMTNIGSMTGFINFTNDTALTTLTTPNVTNVDQDIRVSGCTSLGALSFPVLAHVGGELDFDGSGVVTVSVPALIDSGAVSSGKVDGHNCTSLTTFIATVFSDVLSGGIDLHGCTSLTSLNFDALVQSGEIDVYGCTSLTSLSFGNAGGTIISGSLLAFGCTSLASVVTTGFGASGVAPNSSSDFTGCAISPSANINSILSDYVLCVGGPAFSIDLSGGTSAAPSGQGILDKATINGTPGCSCVTN